MKKKELISKATDILHARDVRKSVPAIKTKLRILDEENHESSFIVKAERKGYLLNESDVGAVLDVLLEIMVDAMRNGEEISLYGIGSLRPHKIAARAVTMVDGSGIKMVDAHLIPRFFPGKPLRLAVKQWELEQKAAGNFDAIDSHDGDEDDSDESDD